MSKTIKWLDSKKKIIFYIMFAIAILFCLWKCGFGFGRRDEALYLDTTYRLYQGDSLFYDEQHRSQLYSFILLPIMKLYMLLFQNTDGILINFRYIYVFFQIITSLFIVNKLKKYNEIAAYISSIIFLLYAPYNLMALSYNTICYITLAISLILLFENKNKTTLVISGITYALSVLCCPFLALTYFLWAIIVLINHVINKDNKEHIEIFIYFTIGILLCAVIFIVFCLSRTSIVSIYMSIDQIIIDPEYPEQVSIIKSLISYIIGVIQLLNPILVALIAIILFIQLIDKNKEKRKIIYYISYVFIDICMLLYVFINSKLINYIILPLNIMGLLSLLFLDKTPLLKKYIFYFLIPSILYTFYINMSSDCDVMAISSASIVQLIGSITTIAIATNNINKSNNFSNYIVKIVTLSLCGLLLMSLSYEKYIWVFGNIYITSNTELINQGPYKGVKVPKELKKIYDNDYELANIIKKIDNANSVVILSDSNWMYLMLDEYRNAGPSAWKTCFPKYLKTINNYYRLNENKMPDIVFVGESFINDIKNINILDNYEIYIADDNYVIYTR